MKDRSDYPTRKLRLGEDAPEPRLSAEAALGMMWQLTLQAWSFKEGRSDEPRLQRHVGRVVRGRR